MSQDKISERLNEFFPGDIDDVLLFGKALNAADVDELYQRTKP